MATIPDVDTSKVSFISYFNCISQGGVNDIDPSEVTSYGNISNYTVYDNGVAGTINNVRDFSFRVKEDGWIVVYMDRTEDFGQNDGNYDNVGPTPADVLGWYTGGNTGLYDTQLENEISSLISQLSNSGSITQSANDVGLYSPWFPSASNITLDGFSATNREDVIRWTSTTTVKAFWAAGRANGRNAAPSGNCGIIWPDASSYTFASAPANGVRYGSVDVEDEFGLQADSDYTLDANESDATTNTLAGVLLWS